MTAIAGSVDRQSIAVWRMVVLELWQCQIWVGWRLLYLWATKKDYLEKALCYKGITMEDS